MYFSITEHNARITIKAVFDTNGEPSKDINDILKSPYDWNMIPPEDIENDPRRFFNHFNPETIEDSQNETLFINELQNRLMTISSR